MEPALCFISLCAAFMSLCVPKMVQVHPSERIYIITSTPKFLKHNEITFQQLLEAQMILSLPKIILNSRAVYNKFIIEIYIIQIGQGRGQFEKPLNTRAIKFHACSLSLSNRLCFSFSCSRASSFACRFASSCNCNCSFRNCTLHKRRTMIIN